MKKNNCFYSAIHASILAVFLLCSNADADYKYFYHNYDEILAILEDLQTESSSKSDDIYSLETIGYSHLGNPVYAVKFSDNPEQEEDAEPDIVIDSGIHANEWLPVESNINFIQYLFDAYYDSALPDHSEVVDMINNFEIWIIPVINPDGRMRDDQNGGDPEKFWTDTTYHPDDAGGWRMNLQEVDCPTMPDGKNIGIDLNRCWSRRFWEDSDCRSTIYNGGSIPFIPTEAKVLKQFINNHMISLVFHQHSALNLLFSNSTTIGLGSNIVVEMDSIYEEEGLPSPLLALTNEVEMSEGLGLPSQLKYYRAITAAGSSENVCNGMGMTGQYFDWLWHEIDCPISSDHGSRRAIQCLFYEYPIVEDIYGYPDDGKIGKYKQGDSSQSQHPSSGETVQWIIDRSVEINKYLIKQSMYPFSPRKHKDMSLRSEAPEMDLAVVGAKISNRGTGLPGCFTYRDSDGRDMLDPGIKTVTWNIQNNGTSSRAVNGKITICNLTDDPDCLNPFSESITKEDLPPEAIETFTRDYVFLPERDYSVTLTTGETNDYDDDLKRFIFTTTDSSKDCPAAFISGYDPVKVNLLRSFRDNFLMKTPGGRQCVELFYKHSGELMSILIKNPVIRSKAEKALNPLLPCLSLMAENHSMQVSCVLTDDVEILLDLISREAGDELNKTIKEIKLSLKEKKLFQ